MHAIKFIVIERCLLGLPLMARRDVLRNACWHALLQQVWQLGLKVLAPGCTCLEKLASSALRRPAVLLSLEGWVRSALLLRPAPSQNVLACDARQAREGGWQSHGWRRPDPVREVQNSAISRASCAARDGRYSAVSELT